MKSQPDIVDSDLKNDETLLEQDYYKGREHLFDPKQINQSGSVLSRMPGWVRFGMFIFFAVYLLNGFEFLSAFAAGALTSIISMVIKKPEGLKTTSRGKLENSSDIDGDDLVGRNFSVYSGDKMFTDD